LIFGGIVTKDRAEIILNGFIGKRIRVIGDVMLDEYIWGSVNRISPEAPVMIVDVNRYSHVPGGAANVVNNICALDAKSSVIGIIGDDEAGVSLKTALSNEGADTQGLVAMKDRPTTRKTRVIAHSQQVVRIDHEKRNPLDPDAKKKLFDLIDSEINVADAVLLSDYQKGVLDPEILRYCIKKADGRIPITGNLKPRAIGPSISLTCLTLNLLEAKIATDKASLDTEEEINSAGKELLQKSGSENILITRGADGLTLFSASTPDTPVTVPAHPVEVYDVAGAGDTVISALTLALAAGATPIEAVTLANYAGAEAVKKVGVATISRAEILSNIP
jgi:D-beta-D-heptose 7-phosphate kinase/D-beta-D-heptose 1-phosphate adenosyltransferase